MVDYIWSDQHAQVVAAPDCAIAALLGGCAGEGSAGDWEGGSRPPVPHVGDDVQEIGRPEANSDGISVGGTGVGVRSRRGAFFFRLHLRDNQERYRGRLGAPWVKADRRPTRGGGARHL